MAHASRLTIDYRNAMAQSVGAEHGATDEAIDSLADRVRSAHDRITAERKACEQRWMELPDDSE
ncbi:MAG: hypothetical protein M3R06_04425, partial [Chloroflexota bacterium]|nr:hypothetical protein [Chloroflexota bacterium]